MPLARTKASGSGLGKALINRKAKEAVAPKESGLYSLDESNPLQSVTHERDLDEFLANAALADADFTTERSKLRIIAGPGVSTSGANPFLLNAEEEKVVKAKQRDFRHDLRVPRRPPWTRHTTRQELEKQERESFLDWRRDLAALGEDSSLLMTPFERNIQLWRQLWRVLERSHLVVQIVDARNPLGFRCEDLEAYVKEIGDDAQDAAVPGKGKRRSLLLINKADLLTVEQRGVWADYFERHRITYAFFSAANAAAALEQADRQRRRADGEYDYKEEEADEKEDVEGRSDEDNVSGEEVEPETESDDEEDIAAIVEKLDMGDDEEGWSTEGEDEEDDGELNGEVEKKLSAGQTVPLREVAREVAVEASESDEHPRTRVLSVIELEDLFIRSAPSLSDFATARDPTPTKLVVGLVGYPNVGKSSTINALLGSKKVSVSATPGKTKHFQTLVLSDDVTLCDCPGLVFPQFANTQADMVVDGVLPIDQMKEYSAPVDLLCRRVPREIIEGTYGIRIDVREVEEGGTGKMGWEEMLSAYAIARGMTRASFGMPDTSRAARHILKDYVNARLLFAHPPPNMTADDFMRSSRESTLARLEEEFRNGRKRAPASHVTKNADTYVAPARNGDASSTIPEGEEQGAEESAAPTIRERQATSHQIKANAASAPVRTGKQKAAALDDYYFTESGPAPRPVISGRRQAPMEQEEGLGFSRQKVYPHQRRLGPDGQPLTQPPEGPRSGVGSSKKHFKTKEGKKRSGRGYD